MAIPIRDLKLGSVVRLLSGSPKFTVVGFPGDENVEVFGWGDHVGFVSDKVPALALTWPRTDAPAERPEGDPS